MALLRRVQWPANGGARHMPMAMSWTNVLNLAELRAGMEIPWRPATERYTLMAISRTAMTATGSHQMIPLATSATSAPSTTALSARGSRKAPERVVPCLRATQPSIPSDRARRPPNTKVNQLAPHSMIMTMSTGVASRRSTVMPLAGVSSAEGPKVVARTAGATCRGRPDPRVPSLTPAPGPGRRPAWAGPSATPASIGREVRAVGVGDHYLDERSDRQVSGTVTMPSISGASR